jgi:DNA-binding SARP family transcriptional activator
MVRTGEVPGFSGVVVRFCMLGPLEVIEGGERVTPSRLKERTLLALLLANAGRPVPTAEINHALWGDHPPASARSNLYSYVAELRRALNRDRERLVRTTGGYLLHVEDGEVDATTFERLVRDGRRALRDGRPVAAARELDAALRLWRGVPLVDIESASENLRREVARLVELRLVAVEDLAEANMAAGHDEEVATALPEFVDEYPLRERLWSLLMRAWYRTGRQGEALSAYQRVYRLLGDELGVEPGQELKRVHQEILTSAPCAQPAAPVLAPVPRQLPAAPAGILGREWELAELDQFAADRPVLVLTGFAGTGKTALGLRWAHTVAEEFPDGQLYVDLRGFAEDEPLPVAEAHARLLAPFGVPADRIPADRDESAALYRSVLADRRVLVVLDNARSAEQVRPLLPGSASCRTLVTSRDTMTGLVAGEGAHRITVPPLPASTAVAVLAGIVGRDRADDPAAAELARLCGYVPLALRVAAANLADDPALGIADYLEELVHNGLSTRLSIQGDPAFDVGASIGRSCDRLSPGARTVLHVLANHGPLTTSGIAVRIATPPRAVRPLVAELAAGHLVARDGRRFTVPGLLRECLDSRDTVRTLVAAPAV